MIKIQNLTKKIDQKTVLNDISFKVKKNEVLVVLGKSGAGKSTLISTMNGSIVPDQGEILLIGLPMNGLKS